MEFEIGVYHLMDINWTMGITIMGSCGAALVGQMAANFFTQKREDKKYKKECFRKLYLPLIYRIDAYLDAESSEARHEGIVRIDLDPLSNDLDPTTYFEIIKTHMDRNLQYASPKLIMRYEELKAYTDLYGGIKKTYFTLFEKRLNFFTEFLLSFQKISKELGVLKEDIDWNKVEYPLIFADLYYFLLQIHIDPTIEGIHVLKDYRFICSLLNRDNLNFRERIKKTTKDGLNELEIYLLLYDIIELMDNDIVFSSPLKWELDKALEYMNMDKATDIS